MVQVFGEQIGKHARSAVGMAGLPSGGSYNVGVLLGRGDGTFLAAVFYTAGVAPASVAVGGSPSRDRKVGHAGCPSMDTMRFPATAVTVIGSPTA